MASLGVPCTPAAGTRTCQRRPHSRTRGAPPPRSQQAGQEAATGDGAPFLPPPPPAVGWLWDTNASANTWKRLQEQNLRPKKSLGQNFMLDDDVLAGIVEAAGVQPGDLVLEIGPGTGNLTRHLLAAGALVTAVEKDYALTEGLELEFAQVPQLRLVCGDILRQDLPQLLAGMAQHAAEVAAPQQQQGDAAGEDAGQQQPGAAAQQQQHNQQEQQQGVAHSLAAGSRVKIVANLPYYITKDCLVQLLPLGGTVSALYFMLQDEVGVRLTQRDPGASDWRAMNLLTQYFSQPNYLFKIDRLKYHPAPKVHGAVVAFELTAPGQRLAVPSEPEFIKLVKKAFTQRRKVLRNALRPQHEPSDVAAALLACGLNEDARAQDLTLEEYGKLAWQLQGQSTSGAADGSEQAANAAATEQQQAGSTS